jgi:hypothetical protein
MMLVIHSMLIMLLVPKMKPWKIMQVFSFEAAVIGSIQKASISMIDVEEGATNFQKKRQVCSKSNNSTCRSLHSN